MNEASDKNNSYYMKEARKQREISVCTRTKVGAVIVKDNIIIAKGCNDVTGGTRNCKELGCLRDELNIPHGERREICRAICAEQYAISEAAKKGINLNGGMLYVTTHPCYICSKMLANAGIKKIFYENDYPDDYSKQFLKEANIETVQIKNTN